MRILKIDEAATWAKNDVYGVSTPDYRIGKRDVATGHYELAEGTSATIKIAVKEGWKKLSTEG